LAKAVRLSNHGRRWNVELGERYSAFSDAETAELALLDVHRAAVNNALFFNDPVQSGSLYGTTTLPPGPCARSIPGPDRTVPECRCGITLASSRSPPLAGFFVPAVSNKFKRSRVTFLAFICLCV
jgi:hypothetical protein